MRAALGAVVAAVLVGAGVAAAGNIIRLGPAANGSAVRMITGDSLVLQLPGNAAKGYSWTIKSVDSDVLQFVSKVYLRPQSCCDQPGVFIFRFHARAPLSTTLRLAYGRPSQQVLKRYILQIVVK
jgi:predicted secreted protein